MKVQIISQTFFEEKEFYKKPEVKLRWDQIVMIEKGACSVGIEGEEKARVVQEREILFLPAGTSLIRTVLSPITAYHLSFIAPADHPFRRALQPGKLTLPAEQNTAAFNSIRRAVPIPNNQELIEHIVEHILVEHYLFGKSNKVNLRPLSEEILSTVSYMNRNLKQKLDIDLLAERVYLSHTGLIWKFKQELNTTPSQYLILLRLRYAKQLLLDHDYSITEIAEMCGYSNAYYFTNAFHRYAGMSPTAFRRRYLEALEEKSPDEVTS